MLCYAACLKQTAKSAFVVHQKKIMGRNIVKKSYFFLKSSFYGANMIGVVKNRLVGRGPS